MHVDHSLPMPHLQNISQIISLRSPAINVSRYSIYYKYVQDAISMGPIGPALAPLYTVSLVLSNMLLYYVY
jgi:hypothetical protein